MRKLLGLAALLLASCLSAASSDFDPKEPISLDLKDAKIADVIQTLGAMANLPVLIDPDVEGTVTIRLQEPYDVALERLEKATGVRIRIENGRLVASRSLKPLPQAPPLPEEFRNTPRILLSDYHREASNPPPLFVRVKWNGSDSCYRANFAEWSVGRLLDIALPGSDTADSVAIAQVDYDPISRTRFVAVEALQGEIRRMLVLGTQHAVSVSSTRGSDSLRVLLSSTAGSETCRDLTPRSSLGATFVSVRLEGTSVSAGRPRKLLFAARLRTKTASVVKTMSAGAESESGQVRGFVVAGYVSADGKAIALLFKARAVWTDPKDDREYYFTQSTTTPESEFVPLTRDGRVAATLSPGVGVGTHETVELRVSGGE
jgi:type II secretion system GspD-like secretin